MRKNLIRKALIVIGVVLALLVVVGVIFYKPITTALVNGIVRSSIDRDSARFGKDGLYAGLAGTGSPMADINRAGACVVVMAGEHTFVVDAGAGSARNVQLMKFPIGRLDAVLLTHFHSDHISDLGAIALQRWVGNANQTPVDVIGPTGVEQVVEGFNQAFNLDSGYRVAHHGPETVPPTGAGGTARPFELSDAPNASAVVFDQDGVKVTAFKVDHRPIEPAVGYRFDYKGRSLVVSGDTVYSESLLEQSKGVDVLFHEALNATMVNLMNQNADEGTVLNKVTHDIPSYHATPEDAAKIASAAGVKQLVYYHIIPPLPSPLLKPLFLGDARKYFKGPITMGEDGMLFFLPANSDKIEMKALFK